MGLFSRGSGNKEAAAADSKKEIELSTNRLKPHFINNILSSIYYLCEADPARAQSITMDLSGYLLGTLDTIDKHGLVPFSRELDLIRNYIALEKLRFEDKLLVQYDIDEDRFMVPSLTMQALVENAVKHGISEKNSQGRLQLRTRRLADNGVQISIIDDGVGFDTSKGNSPDSEIAFIQKRLAKEVNGKMVIESAPGEGTSVTITIPEAVQP